MDIRNRSKITTFATVSNEFEVFYLFYLTSFNIKQMKKMFLILIIIYLCKFCILYEFLDNFHLLFNRVLAVP